MPAQMAQKRVAAVSKTTQPLLFFVRLASFQGIPYELKRIITRDTGLGLRDLLRLSHVNKLWRDTCLHDEALYKVFYNVLDEDIRKRLGEIVNPAPYRTIVMLAATPRCMHCKTAITHLIFIPLMLRLCPRCIVDNEEYEVMAKTRCIAKYHVSAKDISCIVRLPYGQEKKEGGKRVVGEGGEMVSVKLVKEIAIRKHGGTLQSLETHLTKQKAIIQEKYNKRIESYNDRFNKPAQLEIGAIDDEGGCDKTKQKPKTRPQEPAILKNAPVWMAPGLLMDSAVNVGSLVAESNAEPYWRAMAECPICEEIAIHCEDDAYKVPDYCLGIGVTPATSNNRIPANIHTGRWHSLAHVDNNLKGWRCTTVFHQTDSYNHLESHIESLSFPQPRPASCAGHNDASGSCYACCERRGVQKIFGAELLAGMIADFLVARGYGEEGYWVEGEDYWL